MATYNRVILLGNLTRDPEVKFLPSGSAVCDLGLALNRQWTDKGSGQRREEVTFVDVTCFGRTAEIAGEYLSKGRQVHIEGRLQMDQWEDRNSGQKRSKLKVICDQLTMVGGRNDGGPAGGGNRGGYNQGGGRPQQGNPQQGYSQQNTGQGGGSPAPAPADDYYADTGGQDFPDDEVPF